MNIKKHPHRIFNIIAIVSMICLGAFPNGSSALADAFNTRLASTDVPAPLADGTPFQQGVKQELAERSLQGLPAPSAVRYQLDVLENTDQHTLVAGRTEIRFSGPEQAGYTKWPEMVVQEGQFTQLGSAAEEQVLPGNYDQSIQDAVEARQPSFWNEHEFGGEPRTLIVWETYETVGKGHGEVSSVINSPTTQSSTATTDSILFGFTYTGPDIHYSYSAEWRVSGVTVVRVSAGFNMDWGMGLRFPFQVDFYSDEDVLYQGSIYDLSSWLTPQDWNQDQYLEAGAPGEAGKEFVLRFQFQASIRIWVALIGDVYRQTVGPDFDVSLDFTPPFYPPSPEFPIRIPVLSPDDTGLKWGSEDYWVGIGFGIIPHFRISSFITADWQAEGDAQGGGQLVYNSLEPIPVGPIAVTDASLEQAARVALSNFTYNFQVDYTYIDIGGLLTFNIAGFEITPADFPIGRIDVREFTQHPWLGVHAGTDGIAEIELPVENPLLVTKTVDHEVVQPGETIVFTTTVTNLSNDPLYNVVASDSHCGSISIGELEGNGSHEYACPVVVSADLASSASVTASGDEGEPYSDTAVAFAYVPDGVVGGGTALSCSEGALDAEIFGSPSAVITFNCGADPHEIALTSTKVIPRDLELNGAGLVTLDGQKQVRVIEVPAGRELTLRGLTISNGWAHRPDNIPPSQGGGGLHNFGTLTLEDCRVLNNSADYGGGIHNQFGGVLTLLRTTVANNQAIDLGGCTNPPCSGDGGGLFNEALATISASRFSDNTAYGGGAIINWYGGLLALKENSVLEGNTAHNGAAIENGAGGQVTILDSTLTNNSAEFFGGAIANYDTGIVTISQSTLSANQSTWEDDPDAPTGGGAIMNFAGGQAALISSLVSTNSSHYGAGIHNQGSMAIADSIFRGNFAINDGGGVYNEGSLSVSSSTFGGSSKADGNRAIGGGGLINFGPAAQAALNDCLLQYNQADNGGALENGGGGEMALLRTKLLNNTAHFIGGGIVNYDTGQVELRASVVKSNQAGDGGGIHNFDVGTILIDEGSVIEGNYADQLGGGIYNQKGFLTINKSSLHLNRVSDDTPKDPDYREDYTVTWGGGGIASIGGQVVIRKSTLSGNQAGYLGKGGGIYTETGHFTLVNTRIIKNQVGYNGLGGGIYNEAGVFELTDSVVGSNRITNGGTGAGIYNLSGSISLLRSKITGNQALLGGSAGGLHNESGSVSLEQSEVSENRAESGQGGGINNKEGVMELSNSSVSDNIAIGEGGIGGGIRNLSGAVTLTSCSITGNTASGASAGYGGGIYNQSGSLTILMTDISSNRTDGHHDFFGGGIYNDSGTVSIGRSSVTDNGAFGQAGGKGGGIFNSTGTVTVSNSTVSGNWVMYQSQGGGFYNERGSLTIEYSTIANNLAYYGGGIYGQASLLASIVANTPGVIDGLNCGVPISTSGWNIESGHSCNLIGPGDRMDTDPLLNPLGGCCGTSVHTPMEGSPAIDQIPYRLCMPLVDQCGNPRPHSPGLDCDIGAYEVPLLP